MPVYGKSLFFQVGAGQWVESLSLNERDKAALEKGRMLTDKHMDAANRMLSTSHLLGLQSTLLVQTDGGYAQMDLDCTGGYLPEGTMMVC